MPREADIFVSHAHADNEWCRAFVARVRQSGLTVWYDEYDMGYGMLAQKIVQVLRDGLILVVVLSPAAVASSWVWFETGVALGSQAPGDERIVLPVLAQACDIPPLWSTYKRLSGPADTSLTPDSAAQSVAQMFGRRQSWDEETAFASFARCCSAEGLAAARHLYNFVRQQKASFAWGKGPLPSLSARFLIGGTAYSIFTLYEWPAGKALCAINFEYLVVDAVPTAVLARLADRLRTIPKVTECLEGLEQAAFKKRPVLPFDPILAQPGAVETIESAVLELVESATA